MNREPESVLLVHFAYRRLGGEGDSFEQEAALLRSRGHRVIEYRRSNAELPEHGLRSRAATAARLVWARDAVR